MLSELIVDGNAVTTASSYEFTNVSSSHTITAIFSPISYTISYNLDGGTVAGNPTNYTVEDTITLNNPEKVGYTFIGWTGTELNSATKDVIITTGSTGNRTYTATYSPISYTIKYNGNGATSGSMSDSSHIYGVTKALTTNSFSRTGYNFLGWSTSSSIATVTYTDGQNISNLTTTNGATVNLYAVWGETLVLTTPTGSTISTTEISVSISGTLGSGSGDIIYKLYVGGKYKSTVTGASGNKVTLNATGLTASTTYSCYVIATSKINSAVTATSSTVSVKTYACMGDTYQCTLPTSACSTCGGWGTTSDVYNSGNSSYCSTCGTSEKLIVCSCGAYGYFANCGTWYKIGTTDASGKVISGHVTEYSIHGYCTLCSNCNGAVYLTNPVTGYTLIRCQHGQSEAHKYCSHGEFEPHY